MADRIYKGVLVAQNDEAFPEAAEHFNKPHAGGLVPFQLLYQILRNVASEEPAVLPAHDPVKKINGSIWVSDGMAWIKIEPEGTIEIGAAGV